IGLLENILHWIASFLTDCQVTVVVDRFKGQIYSDTAGLPQGLPVSPILFIIYISRIFSSLESQFPQLGTFSFIDNTTFLVAGILIQEVAKTLQDIGEKAITWGQENKVEFKVDKTEVIFFSRSRKTQ